MVAVLNGIHESKQAKSGFLLLKSQRIEYKWGCRSDPHLYSFLKNNQHSSNRGLCPTHTPAGSQPPAPLIRWLRPLCLRHSPTLATRQEAAITASIKAFKACHVSMASIRRQWRPLTLHALKNRNREHFRASEGAFAKCQSESGWHLRPVRDGEGAKTYSSYYVTCRGVLPTILYFSKPRSSSLSAGEEEIVSLVHNYHIGGANPPINILWRGFRGNPPDRGFRGQRSL